MIKWGVIGTFYPTGNFIKAIIKSGDSIYAAQYSEDLEKAKEFSSKFSKVECYDSLEEMLDSNIDAVYIASPKSLHFSQAKLCLQKNKHVFVEKPIVQTVSELDYLENLANKNNLIICEAQINFFTPQTFEIKEEIINKKIKNAYLDFSKVSSSIENSKNDESVNPSTKDIFYEALMDVGTYPLHLAIDFFGYPRKIIVKYEGYKDVDGDDAVILKYKDFDCRVTFSKLRVRAEKSYIEYENGKITIDDVSRMQGIRLIKDKNSTLIFRDCSIEETMAHQIYAFCSFVRAISFKHSYLEVKKQTREVIKLTEQIKRLLI